MVNLVQEQYKFEEYADTCPDPLCVYSSSAAAATTSSPSSSPLPTSSLHYHCQVPRCFYATNVDEQLLAHSVDFHENYEILDGFLFFDSSVDCRLENCRKYVSRFRCVFGGRGFFNLPFLKSKFSITAIKLVNISIAFDPVANFRSCRTR